MQHEYAEEFRALHQKGKPLIIYNIWDVGSAKAVADAGAKAIGTGSAPIAMARGFEDGENVPIDLLLDNVRRICEAVDKPVSIDFEGAYGVAPEVVARNFSRALDIGVVGFNFEDQIVGGQGLHDIETQSARIRTARAACAAKGVNAFINARTDIFLKARAAKKEPTNEMLGEAIARAKSFADAGADGFFAPGLIDLSMIETLCDLVELPVNIIALPGAPSNEELAKVGVARISYGPVPYNKMINWLTEEARTAFGD